MHGVALPQKCVPHILPARSDAAPPQAESEASEMLRRHILSAVAPRTTRNSADTFSQSISWTEIACFRSSLLMALFDTA